VAQELCDRVAADGGMEIVERFNYELPFNVIAHILGIPERDFPEIKRHSWDFARAGERVVSDAVARRGDAAARALTAYFESVVEERRREPREDLLSSLIAAEDASYAPLLAQPFDVVQCCSFTDAFAASLARSWTGTPYAFFVNGLPPRVPYFKSLTTKGAVFRRAVLAADELIVPSAYVGRYCEERYGRMGCVMAPPVNLDISPLSTQRDHANPMVLCAADLSDQRKGGEVLMRAFNIVKAARIRTSPPLR